MTAMKKQAASMFTAMLSGCVPTFGAAPLNMDGGAIGGDGPALQAPGNDGSAADHIGTDALALDGARLTDSGGSAADAIGTDAPALDGGGPDVGEIDGSQGGCDQSWTLDPVSGHWYKL